MNEAAGRLIALAAAANETGDLDGLHEHVAELARVASSAAAASVVDSLRKNSLGKQTGALAARLRDRKDRKENPLPTPWEPLNRALTGRKEGGGFWPGLHFLVGGTGSGKTQFALQCALHAALARTPVLYVNLELAPLDLFTRLACLLTGQKWSDVWNGTEALKSECRPGYPNGTPEEVLATLPLNWIDASRGWPYTNLVPHTQALRELHGTPTQAPVLVVVDFLQLMGGKPGDRGELRERISDASYACRTMARDHAAVVLAVSSVAREQYAKLSVSTKEKTVRVKDPQEGEKPTRKVKPPVPWNEPAGLMVGLGKESGDLEFSADSVLVMVREKWEGSTPPKGGTQMHLAVAKLRAGPEAWLDFTFNGSELSGPTAGPTFTRPLNPHTGNPVKSDDIG